MGDPARAIGWIAGSLATAIEQAARSSGPVRAGCRSQDRYPGYPLETGSPHADLTVIRFPDRSRYHPVTI
jgi:hypothetical protein